MTTNLELTLEHGYNIRSYEPRMDGHVSIASLCNQLQDIASRHADSLGFGFHDLEESGHFWILARLHIMVNRLPRFGERTSIRTWPSGNERLVALRDFLIHDADGLIGQATTSWVTMNKQTHRPDKPDQVLNRRFIPDREHAIVFPTKSVTRLKQGDYTADLTARRADIDINGHVNNVKHVELCFEAVPPEWADDHRCRGLDIQFRAEAFAGDKLRAACALSEPDADMDTMLHSLTRVSDDKEIVRMRSWWRKA
ncbi:MULTISPECIES: acyl-ACP thioesterase domain-containing protein [unclassified Pseudodesulfovibrio]|uniref:acyl-[acyl-carrier-protein] thioesterase n=1 Tax=unclassified Pseudodesulfovibrio TaxID=2661612 RepID=UPI000FEB8E26|nr:MULTISPECIES: acyl-ACP thioesterase domain-containing protein [unclassified Pseudodesulfovibrio]MCJ2163574.1 thioesterase [Pseudodesulfovibrio sp. S3-i]RWU06809.1 acyl-ACP thioesterase [Pseudodesulfovibrio sp. S3]